MRHLSCTIAMMLACIVGHGEGASPAPHREVTDLTGRRVRLPAQVSRVGCMTGASFEKVLLVGGGDKVVVKDATCPPWAKRVFPGLDKIRSLPNSHDLNLEEFHHLKPDALFFWDDAKAIPLLQANGFNPLVPQPSKAPVSEADFLRRIQDEVLLYGKVLGPAEEAAAKAWCRYFREKVEMVRHRTAGIPPAKRPKVYYVRGPNALNTHGADQNVSWYGKIAGGHMVVRDSPAKGIAQVSMEQLLLWNPEVILVGRQYSAALVLEDQAWKNVAAVRNHKVLESPDGVFWWDGGSEGVLLLLYMAKAFHPELFKDLDLPREVKEYYSRFYHTALSDREIALLLAGKQPDGSRGNRLGN